VRSIGRLIAAGRDCDVFEYGAGLVLRRSRSGRSMIDEARTMDWVREHGYPVPAVAEVSDDGKDLVMERVEGPSMVEASSRKPWTIRRQGLVLAQLHQRLHEIPGPEFLAPAPVGDGDRLVHLDLHPLNVIVSADGPVVIDWTNAARGDPSTDVAAAWLLLAVGELPAGGVKGALLGLGRSQLLRSFLGSFDIATIAPQLLDVVEWKVRDPNFSTSERDAMRRLVQGNPSPN
jgi:aminoglycoside phosphotransferase (APT) family kinase protein